MNQQRTLIYKQRQKVLDGGDLREDMINMINGSIDSAAARFLVGEDQTQWDIEGLKNKYFGLLCGPDDFNYSEEELKTLQPEDITEVLRERAMKLYTAKEEIFGDRMREIERVLLLKNVDTQWMDHLDAMDDLKDSVQLNAYAQRSPINEFRIIGAEMFDEMIETIRDDTVRMVLSVMPREREIKRVEVSKVTGEGFSGGQMEKPKPKVVKKSEKVGRNDPCPCGSGKKYKKCCGAADNTDN